VNTTRTLARPSFGWLATALAAGLLTALLAGPGIAAAQTPSNDADDTLRTISVNGVGRVMAEPDVADINLGVTAEGKEAADAAAKAATAMDSVVTALLEMGIAENDIQTVNLSLNPRYDWNKEPAQIVGWEASNMVSVTIRDIDAVGATVDAATDAGATNVNGISFRVEDPTEAQMAARSSAVADARAKADQLAADAGVEIIGIVSISESGGQQPQPLYMARAEMAVMSDAAAETPVMPGEVELSVNVFVQYEIDG
jgi:uncharacterized protein YggE